MREICIPKLPFKLLHHPFTKNLQLFEPLYHLFPENLQSSNSCAIHSQKFFRRLIAAHLIPSIKPIHREKCQCVVLLYTNFGEFKMLQWVQTVLAVLFLSEN